jgi:hypothetical protein
MTNALIDTMPKEQIYDVDLSNTDKKTFMIKLGEDNIQPLRLNPTDLMFVKRLNSIYPRLRKNAEAAIKELEIDENKTSDEILAATSEVLDKIDSDMRSAMDELFDTNVSEVCAPSGSMYDPINGKFRFEHIIESLSDLYSNKLGTEVTKIMNKLSKHTNKYLK